MPFTKTGEAPTEYEAMVAKHCAQLGDYFGSTDLSEIGIAVGLANILLAVLQQLDDEEMTQDILTSLQLVLAKQEQVS